MTDVITSRTAKRIGGAVVVLAILWTSVYTVSETDTAIVTLFGRQTRTVGEAGLHFKWPVESVLRFDRIIDLAHSTAASDGNAGCAKHWWGCCVRVINSPVSASLMGTLTGTPHLCLYRLLIDMLLCSSTSSPPPRNFSECEGRPCR